MKFPLLILAFVVFLFAQNISTYKAFLPNPEITPGAIIETADSSCICKKGYSSGVRNVPKTRKDSAYSEYSILNHKTGEYEIDHLISLELGGSNDIKNLWPQSYLTNPWNAHVKDKLENRLHLLVCKGKISLKEAQGKIRTDWIAAYREYIGQLETK